MSYVCATLSIIYHINMFIILKNVFLIKRPLLHLCLQTSLIINVNKIINKNDKQQFTLYQKPLINSNNNIMKMAIEEKNIKKLRKRCRVLIWKCCSYFAIHKVGTIYQKRKNQLCRQMTLNSNNCVWNALSGTFRLTIAVWS